MALPATGLLVGEIFEFFGDINLILKIFVLITIASWVRNHLGDSPLTWILIGGIGYFVLFDGWAIFGPVYFLYILLGFGVSSILIDFFFIGGGSHGGGEESPESPVSSGVDIMKRMQEQAHHAQLHRRG